MHPSAFGRRLRVALLAGTLLGLLAGAAAAGRNWDWHLPKDLWKTLNPFQRAQYDKAAKLFREGEEHDRRRRRKQAVDAYAAAATEFRKFRVQYGQNLELGILPHVMFMEARSLHEARERYRAIKLYTELLDLYPDELWIAAPALYFRGLAHFANGDERAGLEDMKAMIEDPDYREDPLAAGALRRLADNHWRNQEPEQAVRYWKLSYKLFASSNWEEAKSARTRVLGYYIRNQRYESVESWLVNDEKRSEPGHRRGVAEAVWDVAWHGFHGDWNGHYEAPWDEKRQDMAAFWDWYKAQRHWYAEAENLWRFFDRSLHFLCHRYGNKEERGAIVDEAIQFLESAELEQKEKDQRYAWMSDRLRRGGDVVAARAALGKIEDRSRALWHEHEILGHNEHKWAEAAAVLEELEQRKSDYWTRRARRQRAWIYKDRTREYDKAIQLYQQIADPPWTLWQLQECYRRSGRTANALRLLSEIASMFPQDAARAIFTQAEYHRHDGNREKAIALYRRVLAHPDWKKTREASRAHQRLEDYGIETGGGVGQEEG